MSSRRMLTMDHAVHAYTAGDLLTPCGRDATAFRIEGGPGRPVTCRSCLRIRDGRAARLAAIATPEPVDRGPVHLTGGGSLTACGVVLSLDGGYGTPEPSAVSCTTCCAVIARRGLRSPDNVSPPPEPLSTFVPDSVEGAPVTPWVVLDEPSGATAYVEALRGIDLTALTPAQPSLVVQAHALLDAAGITAGPLPDRVRHAIQARDDASAHAADFVRMHGDYVASAQLAHRLLGDAGVPVGLLGERIRAAVAERDAARAEVAKLTAQRNCAREQRDEEGADFERERDRADDLAAEVHTLRELVQCFARLPSVQP
jgi:hypothetical protein